MRAKIRFTMPKRAGHSTNLSENHKQQKQQPSPSPMGKGTATRETIDTELTKNKQELGVGEDHKTEEMEQAKRGTFP